jgi:hypothetical protein
LATFTPDGLHVVVANEGEPNSDYTVDPEGSVSIMDIRLGVASLAPDSVRTAEFSRFNDAEIDPSIRIYGPDATVAQDLEPEYIAISPDGTTAYVTLQENNALAVVDLADAAVVESAAVGLQTLCRAGRHAARMGDDRAAAIGTTAAAGNFARRFFGALYTGTSEDGRLTFVTHTESGPNPETQDVDGDGIAERAFALPAFQPQIAPAGAGPGHGRDSGFWSRIRFDPREGHAADRVAQPGGKPGMAYADEEPVDLSELRWNWTLWALISKGSSWLRMAPTGWSTNIALRSDHFTSAGVLACALCAGRNPRRGGGGCVWGGGVAARYAQRRANRGFEAAAYRDGILYAFIQSPLDNPDQPKDNSSKAATLVRILAFDTAAAESVGEYFYRLDGQGAR